PCSTLSLPDALPICLIRRMQALARERFPDADPNRLPLVPRQVTNRDGLKPLSPGTLARKMRVWVSALSELSGPDGEPFDRATVLDRKSTRLNSSHVK